MERRGFCAHALAQVGQSRCCACQNPGDQTGLSSPARYRIEISAGLGDAALIAASRLDILSGRAEAAAETVRGGAVLKLRPETAEDWWEVEALFDLCFAPGRAALSSYRLRDGIAPVPDLSTVARDEASGILAGAIRYWPVRVGGSSALLLGPIAVHPTHQGEGLGAYLMRDSLAEARRLGWERVMLVGDAPYYGRFGFKRLSDVEMPAPTNPERVLGLDLRPGAWRGIAGKVTRAA